MKAGRRCRDCHVTIHKKCEERFNAEHHCTHEPIVSKPAVPSPTTEDETKSFTQIETIATIPLAVTTTSDEGELQMMKSNSDLSSIPNTHHTNTTSTRFSSKAAAAFSAFDSTARRSFRAFGSRNTPTGPIPNSTVALTPTLIPASELSKSDESLSNASIASSHSTRAMASPSPQTHASSKLASAASTAYSKLREFKSKRQLNTPSKSAAKKITSLSDSSENCLSL
jgi:hypothetical protein